jgi:hypothetical protein
MEPVVSSPSVVPGSLPLKATPERYARMRARMYNPRQAAAMVGLSPTSGACTKLEKKPEVQARIAYLTDQDVTVLREKSAEIESVLWGALRVDPSVYFERAEEPVRNDDGDVLYKREVQRLKFMDEIEPELRQFIEGLTYTEKGKPNLKLISKLSAAQDLRKLLGLDKPAKTDVTLAGGAVIQVVTGVPRAPDDVAA